MTTHDVDRQLAQHLDALIAERDAFAARLRQAERLLDAVGASARSSRGRVELSAELERAVVAFAVEGASVAHYQAKEPNHADQR